MQLPRASRSALAVCAAAALLGALKLWLVSGAEIAARPEDAFHLLAARDIATMRGLDVFTVWLFVVDRSGLPLRFASELLLLTCALVLALCTLRLRHSAWAATAVFALLIFHPVSFDINDRIDPDTLAAPVLLLTTATFMLQTASQNLGRNVALGSLGGIGLAVAGLAAGRYLTLGVWCLVMGIAVLLNRHRARQPLIIAARPALVTAMLPLGWLIAALLLGDARDRTHLQSDRGSAPSAASTETIQRIASSAAVASAKLAWSWIPEGARDHPLTPDSIRQLYDDVANRRTRLTQWRTALIDGWAFIPGDPLVRAAVRERNGPVHSEAESIVLRPDVVSHYATLSNVPERSGFAITFSMMPALLELELTTTSGYISRLPLSPLMANRRGSLSRMTDVPMRVHIDMRPTRTSASGPSALWEPPPGMTHAIGRGYGAVLLLLLAAAAAGAVFMRRDTLRRAALRLPVRAPEAPPALPLAVPAVFVILQVGAVALLDAVRSPVHGYQLLYPGMLLAGVFPVLLLSYGIRLWRERRLLLHTGPPQKETLVIWNAPS
jgi:hypothetical protein